MAVFAETAALLLPALVVLGVLHAVDAVMRARTSQGAMAWAISLVTIPYLAIPLYWIFGRSRFSEYVEMLREAQVRTHPSLAKGRSALSAVAVKVPPSVPFSQPLLEKLAGFPFCRGNELTLLIDGARTFHEIFSQLRAARRYILLQSYILRDDEVGAELKDILTERARAGVRVFLLLDSVGALDLPSTYTEELQAAGVELQFFRAGRRWFLSRFELNFRNHRKTVIVDGAVGFLGGFNFGIEYLGKSERFGHWRDTHLQLRGPALIPQQMTFLADWYWASGQNLAELLTTDSPSAQDRTVLVLPSGPADRYETVSMFFNHLISSARTRLWIASPYAVPDGAVVHALKMAVLRGVDVRFLIPDSSDHLPVYLANFGFCVEAAQSGIRVFRYSGGFMHQKVLLLDDEAAVVGSANFDNRSFRLNFELTALVAERQFAAEVTQMLEQDFANAREFDPVAYQQRSFGFRAAVQMARLFAPVL